MKETKRHPMSFRVTKELKARMAAAVAASGRSICQEVEIRLEQSFDREALLKMVREAVEGGA
jgi:predicted HicB family RNase H-like nuclease